jgi:hypothetical protein
LQPYSSTHNNCAPLSLINSNSLIWGPAPPIRFITKTSAGLVVVASLPAVAALGLGICLVGAPIGGVVLCGGLVTVTVTEKYKKWKYPPLSPEVYQARMAENNDKIYRKFHPTVPLSATDTTTTTTTTIAPVVAL